MELAGSIPTIMATGGTSGAAPAGRLAQLARVAKQGAAYGATSGALSSNALGDIPGNAMKGGAMGAVAERGGADWIAKHAQRGGGAGALLAAAVSSDGRYLAVGGGDRKVHVWDARSRHYIQVSASRA